MLALIVPDGYHIEEVPEICQSCKGCCFLGSEVDDDGISFNACVFEQTIKPPCVHTIYAVIIDE